MAAPKQVRLDIFDAMTDAVLECRESGHRWSSWRESKRWKERYNKIDLFVVIRVCARCASERHDSYIPISGVISSRRYVYAEGYLAKDNGDPLDRDEVRLALMKRYGGE